MVTVTPRSGTPVAGCLIRNARVIDVKDHKGISLNSPDSTKVPYLAELAVNGSHLELLTIAKTYGSFQLYMSADSYDIEKEAVLDEDSQITSYLRSLMTPVPAENP